VGLAGGELERLRRVLALVEELVRARRTGQHEERGRAAEVGFLLEERFEDADRALRVDLELAVLLEVPELSGRRIVEGEDDGRGAGGHRDLAFDDAGQALQAIAARVERLEVA